MSGLPPAHYFHSDARDPLEDRLATLALRPDPPSGVTIALVVPPSPQEPTPGREFLISGPFEGFTAVATLLRRLGHEVRVLDCRRKADPVTEVLAGVDGAALVGLATYCDSFAFLEEACAAIKAAHPERVAQLDRRREIEVAFMYGEIVSPPVPLFRTPKGNSGSPHVAVVSHEGKRHRAIIKFGFSERFSRSGVVAGNGYWREVSGAMHAVGMGVDAPAVVSRRLDRYGPATLMEFLDGSSCEMVSNWFTDSDRRIHPEIFNIAANDWLTWRTDGAPRNLVTTIENTIAVIDFGSDFSTDLTVALSSAALYLVSKLDYEIPEEVRQCVREWGRSTERQIFDQIFALAPEDMSGYRRAYEVRLAQMLAAFDTMDRRIAFPPYSVSFRKDFGREFFLEFLRFGNT
ncbi:MAG: hypothetical protein A2284_07465 [Deltaproteobacteria bacterium RIFOXYA12_FULL_61_11]|nr:MAG: hypothetical protein A2284_07465 [Deltaproteobacteria bacterium RIFOXYA12_FULL_61_11]